MTSRVWDTFAGRLVAIALVVVPVDWLAGLVLTGELTALNVDRVRGDDRLWVCTRLEATVVSRTDWTSRHLAVTGGVTDDRRAAEITGSHRRA